MLLLCLGDYTGIGNRKAHDLFSLRSFTSRIFYHPMGAGGYWNTNPSPPSEWRYMRPYPMGALGLQLSIQRFGFLLGHPQGLSSHVLRRGAANAVYCTVTPGDVRRDWSLLIQPKPTGYGCPEEPDYGTRKG